MTPTASGTYEHSMGAERSKLGGSTTRAWNWSASEIAAMVGGFIVFWPLGLLALFAKWKNREMWPGSSANRFAFGSWKRPDMGRAGQSWRSYRHGFSSSGNAAFDEYKRRELDRLEEERRRLEDEQRAFAEHLERLRKAKDQEEFDRFMAERRARQTPQDGDQAVA
jgi:Protein of unknown function (DUF2852)